MALTITYTLRHISHLTYGIISMKFANSCLKVTTVLVALLTAPLAAATEEAEAVVCDRVNFSGCLNGVTTSVTNGAGLRVTSAEVGDLARERSGASGADGHAALAYPQTTLTAGDEMGGSVFGLWASYSYADYDSDFVFQGNSLAYDADAHNALFGFDRLFADSFLLGLALGYQTASADTVFNGGKQDTDGFTVAPYAALLINDIFSVDVAGGASWLDYDQVRISPTDGTDIGVGFDADRWFISTNLNALLTWENWVFGARIGYLRTDETQDGYVEAGSAASAAAGRLRTVQKRNIDLSQMSVGGDIGYNFGSWEPYFMAVYRNDLSRDDGNRAGGLPGNFVVVQPDDDDEVQLNFGVRLYTTWGASVSAEYQRVEGRSFFDSDTFMFTLRAAL